MFEAVHMTVAKTGKQESGEFAEPKKRVGYRRKKGNQQSGRMGWGLITHSIHSHGQAGTGNIDVHSLQVACNTRDSRRVQLQVRVAGWRVLPVVFESVQVLVAFAANLAAIGLLLFHSNGAGIRN